MKKYFYISLFSCLCLGGESMKESPSPWVAISYTFIDPTESAFLIEPPYDVSVNTQSDLTRHLQDRIKQFQLSQNAYCVLLLDPYLIKKELFWQYLEQFVLLCAQEKVNYKIGLIDESSDVQYIRYFISGDVFSLLKIKKWNDIEVWEGHKKIKALASLEHFENYLANKNAGVFVIHLDDSAMDSPQKFVEFVSILNQQSMGETFKFPYRLYFQTPDHHSK